MNVSLQYFEHCKAQAVAENGPKEQPQLQEKSEAHGDHVGNDIISMGHLQRKSRGPHVKSPL